MATTQPLQVAANRTNSGVSQAITARLFRGLRLALAPTSYVPNERSIFSFMTCAVLGAKFVHLATHLSALSAKLLKPWSYSFFAQDMLLLMLLHCLMTSWIPCLQKQNILGRLVGRVLCVLLLTYVVGICVLTIAFYAVAGSEIHWRNASVVNSSSSIKMFLSGAAYMIVVPCGLLAVSWLLRDVLFASVGYAVDLVLFPATVYTRWRRSEPLLGVEWSSIVHMPYSQIPQEDAELGRPKEETSIDQTQARNLSFTRLRPLLKHFWPLLCYGLTAAILISQLIIYSIRPHETSFVFLSWTPPLLPLVEFHNAAPSLENLVPVYGSGIYHEWDEISTLTQPPRYNWLPNNTRPVGFGDWYGEGKKHYSAEADPLRISNTAEQLLPQLREALKEAPIKHVVYLTLESTRKDLFPIKKDGVIWDRLQDSFSNKTLPADAVKRLATLTATANYVTGDYDDGFAHAEQKKRGGISFNNVVTTSTYTLKSMAGSMCGLNPLLADFNVESNNHFYQPCLPQIFDVLGDVSSETTSDDFTSNKWRSIHLQSVTMSYDKTDDLVQSLGFLPSNTVHKEYLKSPRAKFGYVNEPDVNYFGMAEAPLEDYVRDAFVEAKKNNERVFLHHLTSTSHHPYGMPSNEPYVPLSNGLEDLSRYVNAIGYDDRWLGTILDVLDEQGVANETLVVFVGDHGLSIPENDKLPSYYNPNVACDHIPLVLSHPKLPVIDVDDAVSAISIVPTILDLLVETGSLRGTAAQAALDLRDNFEGQSLIRPVRSNSTDKEDSSNQVHKATAKNAVGRPIRRDWQFTNINPGHPMIGIRDTQHHDWRLVVPIVDDMEWRFSNLGEDPADVHPIMAFSFRRFLKKVERRHGVEAAKWAEEAAFASRWWVEENSKRWRYGGY